jgi:hypothetical protein
MVNINHSKNKQKIALSAATNKGATHNQKAMMT